MQRDELITGLGNCVDVLNIMLLQEHKTSEALNSIQYKIELKEARLLLPEMSKEGAINGSNAEIRKLQTIVFLGGMSNTDPIYSSLLKGAQELREELAIVRVQIQQELNVFSARKYQARLMEER